jgi:asparagine synthase (glutamine-hydrolysing)
MCGIFSLLNSGNDNQFNEKNIAEQFLKGKNRGPEYSKLEFNYQNIILGFHRLAINGLNSESNQPIINNNVVLICNGEIYNYKHLYKYMDKSPNTDSDCEVIIYLYLKYGIEQTLIMLDGVFAFILLDNRDDIKKVFIARDPIGVRPLYYFNVHNIYGFASEIKCLEYFYNNCNSDIKSIGQFSPGTFSVFNIHENEKWTPIINNKNYYIPSFSYSIMTNDIEKLKTDIYSNISYYLNTAIIKRCNTTDRPVACLLSGGLDSSLIASLVANYFRKQGITIETYSIGLENSEDIKYARNVADYIGSKHTEIIVTEEEMFNSIPEVIKAIESYDTTTVRASIGNYLIGKYISQNSEAKVIFNGDGSDELLGGYLYMHKCPDDIEFDKESRRLLKDIHMFDVLRSDKSISSNGLEPRTPFLDRSFVNYVLSIPPYFRNHNNLMQQEKYLLRESFNILHFQDNLGRQILPLSILYRRKEAFSDGVSSKGRSLFEILQEKISEKLNLESGNCLYKANIETEKLYYKQIFDIYYPNCSHLLPYFWMPKYIDAQDPSARTLNVYN